MESYVDCIKHETSKLKMIMEFGNRQLQNKNISLNGKVKKKAKVKYEQIQDKMCHDNEGLHRLRYALGIEFTENLGAKYYEIQENDNEFIIRYNLTELLVDKREITLLMNFIRPSV